MAVERETAESLRAKEEEKKKDKRNLYLSREGNGSFYLLYDHC
jgi:hypothetical protein